jgi:hypothetical protein
MLDKPTTILVIFMKMKPHEKSLGCNPLSDTLYWNLGMVLNGKGRVITPFMVRRILIWIRC